MLLALLLVVLLLGVGRQPGRQHVNVQQSTSLGGTITRPSSSSTARRHIGLQVGPKPVQASLNYFIRIKCSTSTGGMETHQDAEFSSRSSDDDVVLPLPGNFQGDTYSSANPFAAMPRTTRWRLKRKYPHLFELHKRQMNKESRTDDIGVGQEQVGGASTLTDGHNIESPWEATMLAKPSMVSGSDVRPAMEGGQASDDLFNRDETVLAASIVGIEQDASPALEDGQPADEYSNRDETVPAASNVGIDPDASTAMEDGQPSDDFNQDATVPIDPDASSTMGDGQPSDDYFDQADESYEDVMSETSRNDWFHEDETECRWYDAQENWWEDDEGTTSDTTSSHSRLLYEGCKLTVAESMSLVLLFSIRHNITGECMSDLLTLVAMHCAIPNLFPPTVFLFQKFFKGLKAPVVFHRYCSYCYSRLLDENEQTCGVCQTNLSDKAPSFFIECPLIAQVVTLIQRPNFYESLQHRFRRNKQGQSIEDIYDGDLYAEHSKEGGFLSNPSNISLMWYTDGIPLFKSSKYSIWPLYFAINELPYKQRMVKENMLFAGIWYGEAKPLFHLFLEPSIEALEELYAGVETALPDGNRIVLRGFVLCGTCDLPAKSMIMNMTQFNGRHGCAKCLATGCSVSTGSGSTWVYPFEMCTTQRKNEEFVADAERATNSGKTVNGVKGPTWLAHCKGLDLIRGTTVDYMHCVLLGIVRKLLFLWFDSSCSKHPFSFSSVLPEIEKRLANIKPPNIISRVPRSIKSHVKFWKANECRAWLLYYSVPVLYGLMQDIYFDHYCLLVSAVYTLSKATISESDIQHSELLLKHYCYMFEVLYGAQYMSANLHQLLHLPDCVRDLGPLWVYSCFRFEDFNGKLVGMFHGTRKPEVQICSTMSTLLNLPTVLSDLGIDKRNDEISAFLKKLQGTKRTPLKSHTRYLRTVSLWVG